MGYWKNHVFVIDSGTGITLLNPSPNFKGDKEAFIKRHSLDSKKFAEMRSERIPSDIDYMGAWELAEGFIEVNMVKAKEIRIDALRPIRDEKLAKLDVEFMRAVEDGSPEEIREIKLKKQQLRDMPDDPIFEEPIFDDLKKTIPDYLR